MSRLLYPFTGSWDDSTLLAIKDHCWGVRRKEITGLLTEKS